MTREEIIDAYVAELDRHLRSASVARLVRGPARDDPSASCVGGRFLGPQGSSWPRTEGLFLEGIIQIKIGELPTPSPLLEGIKLLQVFAASEEWQGLASYNNGPWEVRTYRSLHDLVPMERPSISLLKPCWIEWELRANEIPSYPDNIELIDGEIEARFQELEGWQELLEGRYDTYAGTKVGGWPYSFQNGAECGEFVLQLGSEPKANWVWGPGGSAFFGLSNGEWNMSWDFL